MTIGPNVLASIGNTPLVQLRCPPAPLFFVTAQVRAQRSAPCALCLNRLPPSYTKNAPRRRYFASVLPSKMPLAQ